MQHTTITKAKKEDVKKIVKIHKDCIGKTNSKSYDPEIIESWLNQINEGNVLTQFENTEWIILKKDGNIIGFAQYSLEDKELYQIQITTTCQGEGGGKQLYKYIEDEFIRNGKDKILLNATLNAKEFYLVLGFKPLKSIFFDGIEMIRMEKTLK